MRLREKALLGLLCPALLAPAATVAARPPAGATLDARLRSALARPALQSAFVGFEVRRVSDGRVLASRDAGRGFTPASVMKLLTTAAALDAFGPDEKVRTTLESTGAATAPPSSAAAASGRPPRGSGGSRAGTRR